MAKKKSKPNRIKAEEERLRRNYAELPDAKKQIAEGLIARAAFMRVELEDLEEDLTENGWTEKFSQGDQEPYDRARPQGQTYHTMNANYQKIIKQLDSMLPKEDSKPRAEDDGFDDFVSGRDDS